MTYGVCGHQNVYSTGVKIGNYVEHRLSAEMASKGNASHHINTTESRSHYCDPATMPDKNIHSLVSSEKESSDGLNYQLIFAHGPGIVVDPKANTNERYLTTNGVGYCKQTSGNVNNLARELAKQQARERRELSRYNTTNAVNARLL